MTQACQRLKPHIRRHCKFLHALSEICLKPVAKCLSNGFPVGVIGPSLQHAILKSR